MSWQARLRHAIRNQPLRSPHTPCTSCTCSNYGTPPLPAPTCAELAVWCIQQVPVKPEAVFSKPLQHGQHVAHNGSNTAQQLHKQVNREPSTPSLGIVRLQREGHTNTQQQVAQNRKDTQSGGGQGFGPEAAGATPIASKGTAHVAASNNRFRPPPPPLSADATNGGHWYYTPPALYTHLICGCEDPPVARHQASQGHEDGKSCNHG